MDRSDFVLPYAANQLLVASIDSLEEHEDGDPDARELKKYDQRYHDFREGKRVRRLANQTHVIKTDLDATLVSGLEIADLRVAMQRTRTIDPKATAAPRSGLEVLPT